MTISEELAQEAQGLRFDQLPGEVVHEAKRRLIDTLGCVIGGCDSPPSRVIQELVRDLGGPREATIIGSGFRTSCMNAALANGVMVRFTEAIDRSTEGRDGLMQHGHPCEVIPAILAVAERRHSTGKDVIAAIVLGYELMNRLSYAVGGVHALDKLGWKHEVRAALIVPLVVGKLLGLTTSQMVNAVGIAGCFAGGLGLLDHGLEPVTMARDLRFPYAAYQSILAVLMAEKGFEGPSRVYEGHSGFNEVVCKGTIDFAKLARRGTEFNIMYTSTKAFPVNGSLQGQTEALVRLVAEHDITPESIARIKITTTPHVLAEMGHPDTHKYPQTKETADHSAYYTAALVVLDGDVHLSLDQFGPARLRDPKVREIIDKIDLVAMPQWTTDQAPTEVEISMVDGTQHRTRVGYFKGHVLNPLTDAELEEKFMGMSSKLIGEEQIARVISSAYRLDEVQDIAAFMPALVFAGN